MLGKAFLFARTQKPCYRQSNSSFHFVSNQNALPPTHFENSYLVQPIFPIAPIFIRKNKSQFINNDWHLHSILGECVFFFIRTPILSFRPAFKHSSTDFVLQKHPTTCRCRQSALGKLFTSPEREPCYRQLYASSYGQTISRTSRLVLSTPTMAAINVLPRTVHLVSTQTLQSNRRFTSNNTNPRRATIITYVQLASRAVPHSNSHLRDHCN